MGSVEIIHDREREGLRELGAAIVAWLRAHRGVTAPDPVEVEWGIVSVDLREVVKRHRDRFDIPVEMILSIQP